jgi:Zn-dependent protease with chaperone function
MVAVLMGIVAVLLAALLVVGVDAAGGWRRVRPATAANQTQTRAETDVAGLDLGRWRTRTVADILQLVLVVALGLTPLGARFVHLVAPRGDTWHGAAAWLLILAAVAAVARLPMLWWRRQMRRTRPELFRPRGGPGQRLARGAIVAARLLDLVLGILVLVLYIRGEARAHLGALSLAAAATIWLLVLTRGIRIRRLPRTDRLSDIVSSLPGGPAIPAVSGWQGAVADARTAGLRHPVIIVVAPPVAAALTDRELRAVLAHEVAHVRHDDPLRRVLRRLLMRLCVLAAMLALYNIPALRSLAGLQGSLSVRAGPFLLAVGYLVFRVLYAMELRASRAEELAADRDMISLTGDPDACVDGLGKLSSLLGIPDAWTLTQRLLFATHPATSERLSLLRDPVQVADVQPRATPTGRVVWRRLLACVLVLGAAVAAIAAADYRAIPMPADAGKYRVLLPRSLDKGQLTLNTTSADAVRLRSSVWGSGALGRFPDAVPVTAVYDQYGQSPLYVWGAYGKLPDPSRELTAFWNNFYGTFPLGISAASPDAEPTGPLGGYLQCENGNTGLDMACAWADNSSIVVVSMSPPGPGPVIEGPITEQQFAAITRSLRAAAEVLAKPEHTVS